MRFSEQLDSAMATMPMAEVDPAAMADGLIVKIARLRHESYPGRDAHGVLPVLVVGHEAMSEADWSEWVRDHGLPHYGAGYTERVIRDGIELKEMLPTAGFGRQMRIGGRRGQLAQLDRVEGVLVAVEKWPQLYNLIAAEMAEQEMTLREFLDRVYNLPSPWDVGAGAQVTLGDIIGPSLYAVTPNF